ncbi:MAG: type II toxin-antitoxin system HicA family toxin [Candidatus Paceibacterota bacterium]
MKRRDLILYLRQGHCHLVREGKKHSVFRNLDNNKISTVPRHREINDFLVSKICKDLGLEIGRFKK